MSFKIIVQLILATTLSLFSTGVAWYEGSTLAEVPWEWKHTAIFTQMINGQVENRNDILPIDYFVYAAKFAPTFPFLMLLSGTYMIILLGYCVFKHNHKMFAYFLFCIGVLFLVLGSFISSSPTAGLKIIFNSLLLIGGLSIAIALVKYFNHKPNSTLKR